MTRDALVVGLIIHEEAECDDSFGVEGTLLSCVTVRKGCLDQLDVYENDVVYLPKKKN